jgi:hypothetical protein
LRKRKTTRNFLSKDEKAGTTIRSGRNDDLAQV